MPKPIGSAGTAFHQWLGLRWEPAAGEAVAVVLQMRDELRGPAGSLEGGIVATLADVAGASTAARALGPMVATQHIAISYLAPGRIGPIRASGNPLRIGKQDAVVQVTIVDLGREDRLMAIALVTVKQLADRTQPSSGAGGSET